jgi:hypothetical protein
LCGNIDNPVVANGASKKCCGTAMICCGSSSDLGSGSGSRQHLAQFSNNNKKLVQNLAFSVTEAALFPGKLASHF